MNSLHSINHMQQPQPNQINHWQPLILHLIEYIYLIIIICD